MGVIHLNLLQIEQNYKKLLSIERAKFSYSGQDEGSCSPCSSRPVSEVFSFSSEYYSRATSSDHIYHDAAESDYSEVSSFQRDLTPRDLTPRDLTPRYLTPRDLTPRDLTPRDVTPRDLTPRDFTFYVYSCYVTSSRNMNLNVLYLCPGSVVKFSIDLRISLHHQA